MAKIVGQEDFVYVWTLGSEGVGDEQDKLVTVDVNPKSKNYGKVLNQKFATDFTQEKLGPPHQMRFNAYSLYSANKPAGESLLALTELSL